MDIDAWMRELAKIKRDRDLVKSALISDAAKASLLEQLAAREKAMDVEFAKGGVPVKR
jgi:hypothetical protein